MKTTKTKAKPSANKTKRSRNGTGHVRLRADGRWEGQYYFEGERKSCYGQTEEECQGKLNVALGKIYRGSYVDGSMMPFYTYMHFWHEKYILVRPATHTNYEIYIEKHIYHSNLGSIPLKKLCLEDFIDFFREKELSGRLDKKPGGLAPKTLRNMRNMMSEALAHAVNRLQWLDRNPIEGLKTPKVSLPQIQVYSKSHQTCIEQAALYHEDKNALMVLIDLYTGLRIGELCGLSWLDFGPGKEYFKIRRILERLSKKWAENRSEYQRIFMVGGKEEGATALYLGPPKTESGKRVVYTNDQAVLGFNRIETYQKKMGFYRPDGFVFVNQNGNPYEPRAYNKLYRDVLQRAGVDYRKFHTLRHTFATRAFELAFDIPTLAEILGHAQKTTTENMYGHSLDDTKKSAMARFNRSAG